jgi:acyl dehydratase
MSSVRDDLRIGQTYEEEVVTNLTRTQIVQYAGASDDFNPLHTDEIFATTVAGYPSVIAHGMLTMGLTGKALTNFVGIDRLVQFGGRFLSVVWPGDSLVTRIRVVGHVALADETVRLEILTVNQHEEAVFSGSAVARVKDDTTPA